MDTLQLECHEAGAWKLAQILPENIWDAEGSAAKEKEVDNQDRRERWRCMVDASWTLEDTGVRFESDCQQLINIINSSKQWPALEPQLDVIESLRATFTSFTFSLISRSLNIRADSLAKEARLRDSHFSIVDIVFPEPLAHEASMLGPV
ncbi:hypothetical protein F2Q68_00003515 [Brassica cretica]|uniref:RNase H type-1 domain-containing protein n=1 Tax=Brassica cretica TaxID=69181 RepID=A0A8S9JH43_BRACR|nr:hypothetical protein F2Q68_00003515 [Brassica cretica]